MTCNPFFIQRAFLSTSGLLCKESFKVVVCGGGSGGISISSKFGRKLGKGNVAVIEPSDNHYYQPLWTLVGAGLKSVKDSCKPMNKLVHRNVTLIKDSVAQFQPDKNIIVTKDGREIEYESLVVALGLDLRYDMVKGLPDAFSTPGVCSNYHKDYVVKTRPALDAFTGGNALFTFPATPIKCAGAPQKIMYIADHYFRKVCQV